MIPMILAFHTKSPSTQYIEKQQGKIQRIVYTLLQSMLRDILHYLLQTMEINSASKLSIPKELDFQQVPNTREP